MRWLFIKKWGAFNGEKEFVLVGKEAAFLDFIFGFQYIFNIDYIFVILQNSLIDIYLNQFTDFDDKNYVN